jgi:hypothetical protein
MTRSGKPLTPRLSSGRPGRSRADWLDEVAGDRKRLLRRIVRPDSFVEVAEVVELGLQHEPVGLSSRLSAFGELMNLADCKRPNRSPLMRAGVSKSVRSISNEARQCCRASRSNITNHTRATDAGGRAAGSASVHAFKALILRLGLVSFAVPPTYPAERIEGSQGRQPLC